MLSNEKYKFSPYFEADLPEILNRIGYEPDEPRHWDVLKIVGSWLEEHPAQISRSPSGKLASPPPASPRNEVAHPEFTEANSYPGCWSTRFEKIFVVCSTF